MANPEQDGGARKWIYDEANTVRPLTLRQVADAKRAYDKAPFVINGHPLERVQIVAAVSKETITANCAKYSLDDGTCDGVIDARMFIGDKGKIESVFENGDEMHTQRYISIIGKLDELNGKNTIKIHSARAVEDVHEPLYHILNVIAAELLYERGPPPADMLRGLTTQVPQAQGTDMHANDKPGEDEEALARERPIPTSSPVRAPIAPVVPQTPAEDVGGHASHTPKRKIQREAAKSPSPSPSKSIRRSIRGITLDSPDKNTLDDGEGPLSSPTPMQKSRRSTPKGVNSVQTNISSPNTEKESRRLSTRDPLSHLTLLARRCVLVIMEETHSGGEDRVYVGTVAARVRGEMNVTPQTISDALDELMDAHLIEAADPEGTWFRPIDIKGKKKAYDLHM